MTNREKKFLLFPVPSACSACSAGKILGQGRAQKGVALVITLILLSVITFMAVTFLVVSRRESEQVNTLSQQNNAKFAATIAADYAQAQVIAQIKGNNNGYNFGLMVSTNFINPTFNAAAGGNLTNVSYYDATGNLLVGNTMAAMQNNLLILPRPPVFITTNKNQTNADFRFYLDLNRNGKYDTNGYITLIGDDNAPVNDASGFPITNYFAIGDPEWIGILDHPDQRHSSSNFFIGRYAFIALPIGNTLDLNYIHNQAKQISTGSDGFLRNQGVGSWEINLAGFLSGLNTNLWSGYSYDTRFGLSSAGFAFQDANSILQYRYNNSYNNLRAFGTLYAPNNGLAPVLFGSDFVDGYSRGPLMTNLFSLTLDNDAGIDNSLPWSGDDNPKQFFTTQDLLNSGAAPGMSAFTTRLYNAGAGVLSPSTYNRYTFYNMLSQIGVGSAPEPYPYPYISKLNLNYANVGANGNITASATNFNAWTPVQFFTNATIRLLRSRPEIVNSGLCTNGTIYIPIYPTNFYTPSVHRMLQLAANIYDANTNRQFEKLFTTEPLYFPSVFRPTFARTGTGTNMIIYINGYTEVTNVSIGSDVFNQPVDLRRTNDAANFLLSSVNTPNVYGIPYVIGAKRGFPNFNSFTMVPVVQVSRAIQIVKPTPDAHLSDGGWRTNILYQIGISNMFGASCWNSYMSNYSRPMAVYATNELTMTLWLTNNLNQSVYFTTNFTNGYASPPGTPILANTWSGVSANPGNSQYSLAQSFRLPLFAGTNWITNLYVQRVGPLGLTTSSQFQNTPRDFYPRWSLVMTNRLRVILQDYVTGRLIDYVQLGGSAQMNGLDTAEDINGDLQQVRFKPNNASGLQLNPNPPGGYSLWTTNIVGGSGGSSAVPRGIFNQLYISQSSNSVDPSMWIGVTPSQISAEVSNFVNFLSPQYTGSILYKQAPFVAFTIYTNTFTWSANDPLVHYMASDLNDLTTYTLSNNLLLSTNVSSASINPTNVDLLPTNLLTNLRQINNYRYLPWSNNTTSARLSVAYRNLAYKDPLIVQSDSWQFPTNRFPNIGWLGRVHRGTPWQTVYLKSSPIADANVINHAGIVTYPNGVSVTNIYANHASWEYWSGNTICWPGSTNVSDASISEPTNDWKLLDLFTTAPNENASRGQLSVNQTGMAAWAAILDGVITVTNTSSTNLAPFIIDPTNIVNVNGTFTNTIGFLASAINSQRNTYSNHVFTSMGDILSVSNLTVASPFLNTNNTANLSDVAYERIPQQILSLLRVGTPRYVIYSYGQSLKPADRSIYQGSGPYFGMCTNYQITGEVVTRTVVRFEPTNSTVLSFPPASPVGPMRPVVESFTVLPPE